MVCSNFKILDAKGITHPPYFDPNFVFPNDPFIAFLTFKRMLVCSPTTLYRTDVIKKMGGYNEKLFSEDFEMWIKILSKYKVFYCNQTLTKYRRHDKNVSSQNWERIIRDCHTSIKNFSILSLTKNQKKSINYQTT